MLLRIPDVLTAQEVAHCRKVLEQTPWVDGNATSGEMSALAKDNLQAPEDHPEAKALGNLVMAALNRCPAFMAAALPSRVFPPLFNRYDAGMRFEAHVDNAIRIALGGGRIRTDVSTTLFLTDPADYDGGELVIEDAYGQQAVKLAAGDLILYPATSLHRVNPITRGSRWSCFFWSQSMVRDDGQRSLLYDLDQAIIETRAALGDKHRAALSLTGVYHNLLRRWAEV
jgi:PKHD-type hydroxylase